MADKPRTKPYIWVSWITKLLSREDRCWYKGWFKAHHQYDRVPDDPERKDFFKKYQELHDAITTMRANQLRAEGYTVKVEDDAAFKLVGDKADVAAKPDLAAVKDGTVLVCDAKSGKPRDSDHWQVLIYMLGLPMSWAKGLAVRGEVQYKDGPPVPVRPLGKVEREAIVATVQRLAQDAAPEPVPSPGECRYCDVASCTARYTAPEGSAAGLF